MWVLIDDEQIEIEGSELEEGEEFIYFPYFGGLKEKLEIVANEIRSTPDSDQRECEEKCLKF